MDRQQFINYYKQLPEQEKQAVIKELKSPLETEPEPTVLCKHMQNICVWEDLDLTRQIGSGNQRASVYSLKPWNNEQHSGVDLYELIELIKPVINQKSVSCDYFAKIVRYTQHIDADVQNLVASETNMIAPYELPKLRQAVHYIAGYTQFVMYPDKYKDKCMVLYE